MGQFTVTIKQTEVSYKDILVEAESFKKASNKVENNEEYYKRGFDFSHTDHEIIEVFESE